MIGREDKITNNRTMFPALKKQCSCRLKDSVKIELFKGAGLLLFFSVTQVKHASERKIVPARRVSAREAIFARMFWLLNCAIVYLITGSHDNYWFFVDYGQLSWHEKYLVHHTGPWGQKSVCLHSKRCQNRQALLPCFQGGFQRESIAI